jgi:hypothetical protein
VNGIVDHLHHSELQVITALSLISTLYKSSQHMLSLFPACCAFNSRSLATASTVEIPQHPALTSLLSGEYPTTELLSTVNYSDISSQPSLQNSTELTAPTVLVITSRHGPHIKHSSSIVAFVFIAAGKCLLSHCVEKGRCLFTYLAVVAWQRMYTLQYFIFNGVCRTRSRSLVLKICNL